MVNGMRTTIDKAGRIVVPKVVRDAMGLAPGRRVDIVFTDGRLEISATPVELEMTTVDGLPVLQALEELPPLSADAVRETQESIRAERGRM